MVYGRGGERDLLCDIYRPAPERTKHTAIVHLHGGGFRGGSKAGARLARPLAGLGYTCVSATYRVMDQAFWPAQIHDAKAAIRWTRAHAGELGVAAEKVVVLGYSAGGRLRCVTAGTQNDAALEGDSGSPRGWHRALAACVAFYAPRCPGKHGCARAESDGPVAASSCRCRTCALAIRRRCCCMAPRIRLLSG